MRQLALTCIDRGHGYPDSSLIYVPHATPVKKINASLLKGSKAENKDLLASCQDQIKSLLDKLIEKGIPNQFQFIW